MGNGSILLALLRDIAYGPLITASNCCCLSSIDSIDALFAISYHRAVDYKSCYRLFLLISSIVRPSINGAPTFILWPQLMAFMVTYPKIKEALNRFRKLRSIQIANINRRSIFL